MGIIADILKSVSKPGRDLAEINRLLSTTRRADPNINKDLDTLEKRLAAQRGVQGYNPKFQSQEEQLGMFLRPGETTLRNAATVGALAAPVGTAGNIASRAGAGALGGALGGYGMTPITQETDVLGILRSAGLGGVLGGTIGAVEKGLASRAAKGGDSWLTQQGKKMEKGASGIKTPKSPTGQSLAMDSFDDVNRITSKYKANPDIGGIDKAYKGLSKELSKSIRASQVSANVDDIALSAAQRLADDLGVVDEKALRLIDSTLSRAGKGGVLDAQGLASLKSATQPAALKAQRIIDTGGNVTAPMYAQYVVNSAADDLLKAGLDDAGRAIYQDMAILHSVAPDIVTKADKAGHITIANVKLPTLGIPQKAQAIAGKALQKVGGARIPQVSQDVLENLGNAGIFSTRLGQAIGREQEPQMQPEMPMQQIPQQNKELNALNMMLAQEVLSGNISASEANAVLSLLGMDRESSKGPTTDAGRKAMVAKEAAINSLNLLSQNESVSGKTQGIENWFSELLGSAGEGTAYKQQLETVRSQIFNALGGANLTPMEKAQYEKFLPKVTDSPAIARQKLESLIPMLDNLMGSSVTSRDEDSPIQY